MKKALFILIVLVLVLSACVPAPQPPAGPGVETIVAATFQALTASAPTVLPATSSPNGYAVSFQNVSFILPQDVAASALAGTIPAIPPKEDFAWWDVAPEHIKFQLETYQQFLAVHDATILVYPTEQYAAFNESAGQSLEKLQAILNGSAPLTAENLPGIAFFNAGQAFAAQIQLIQFNGGSGVRFLCEYAQYHVTGNNRDLFYQFQGLTSDGKYYIIAILPTSHPLLPIEPDPAFTVPSGGIPFPGYEDQAALDAYYPALVNLLNSAAPDGFSPAIPSLDALIQSISITSQ